MREILRNNPWAVTAVIALIAVLAAMFLRHVVRATLTRLARGNPLVLCMLKDTEQAGATVFPLLALLLVWQAAPHTLANLETVRHVTALALIGCLTWFAASIIGGVARGVIERNPVTMEDNLQARRIVTQTNVLSRTAQVIVIIAGGAMALMTFPSARQVGASLLASAGVLGIVGGIAARPVFSNLIAGLQIALAQPIRLDDVLIVNGEWGKVEEITGTYVVLKIWDERRMIIPLQWFIENPFQNWTRTGSQIIGTLYVYVDYRAPIAPIRAEAQRLAESAPEWDGRVFNLQVTDITDKAVQLRVMVSSRESGKNWDLRCRIREGLLAFLAREYPQLMPTFRVQEGAGAALRPPADTAPAPGRSA